MGVLASLESGQQVSASREPEQQASGVWAQELESGSRESGAWGQELGLGPKALGQATVLQG